MAFVFDDSQLRSALSSFRHRFTSVPIFSVGKSSEGRNILCLKIGRGPRRIFFVGTHHGTEWMTGMLLMQFSCYLCDESLLPRPLLDEVTLYLVPLVNPDGVCRAADGTYWQANARGVDLNHNYNALWEQSKHAETAHGVFGPGPTRFSGAFPESEPETRAIAGFTRQNNFDRVFAFHSQGEVIYYDFQGYVPPGTEEILRRMETVSPYRRANIHGIASTGGYKDWFIQTFRKPGFTIEIGKGKNPLPPEQFPEIFRRTLPLMIEALK